jgi:predicted P-loop ATPase
MSWEGVLHVLRGSLTPDRNSSTILEEVNLDEAELTALLAVAQVGPKDGLALVPALFNPCPPMCRKVSRGKFCCAGNAPHRLNKNVREVTFLAVDCDHLTEVGYATVLERLDASGSAFWAWETYSHRLPSNGSLRALLPLAEPIPVAAWPWARTGLFDRLGFTPFADPATADPARLYYLPRKPRATDDRESIFVPRPYLDWRAMLGDPPATLPTPAVDDVEPGEDEDPDRPVDLAALRDRLARVREPLMGVLLAGRALSPPPDRRAPGQPARFVAWRTVTAVLANCLDGWESSQIVLEGTCRASHQAEISDDPSDHTDWSRIEELFLAARASAPRYKADRAAREQAERTEVLTKLRAASAARRPGVAISAPAARKNLSEEELASQLEWRLNKDGNPIGLKITASNVCLILRHEEHWRGVFRFNLRTQQVEVWGGPLDAPGHRALKDSDIIRTAVWLSALENRLSLTVSANMLYDCIRAVAEGYSYEPLHDYLESLRWDGVPRVEFMLERYFRAKLTDEYGFDVSPYVRAISRRWPISAVARAYDPGCQVDTVLEIESPDQGKSKSKAFRALGGEFFGDPDISARDKDSWSAFSRFWIIELAELETYRRSEASAIKALISRRDDTYRPAYGRVLQTVPRCSVFVGTTNVGKYLVDETGNRRHWPVTVGQINLDALRVDRDQIWAEAVALYKSGAQWHLTVEEEKIAKQQAGERLVDDLIAQAIERWYFAKAIGSRPEYVTGHDVCVEVLKIPVTQAQPNKIGAAFRRLGWTQHRKRTEDGRALRGYFPPGDWPELPHRRPPGLLSMIRGEKA